MLKLKEWEKLPASMQCREVLEYYTLLHSKKKTIFLKRLFDVTAGICTGIVLIPVMVVIAVLIKINSRGTVFFKQQRVTTYGKKFMILKFRTMIMNAENSGAQITSKGDMRITGIGRVLRKCRLDELPQIFNVITGDMSFVGARPEVVKYAEQYTPEMLATLLLPAGITSKASIQYKDEEELLNNAEDIDAVYINKVLPEKMKYNLKYLEEMGMVSDIRIMFETVFSVLRKNPKEKS